MRNKCICIKNYGNFETFKKDNYYEYTDKHFVSREYPEGYNVQFSKGEYLYFRKYQDPLAEKGYGMFGTYFKTLKEIRKEKLKKICQKYSS